MLAQLHLEGFSAHILHWEVWRWCGPAAKLNVKERELEPDDVARHRRWGLAGHVATLLRLFQL